MAGIDNAETLKHFLQFLSFLNYFWHKNKQLTEAY